MSKRIISILLVLCILTSCLVSAVGAETLQTGYAGTIKISEHSNQNTAMLQLDFHLQSNGALITAGLMNGIVLSVDADVFELCTPTGTAVQPNGWSTQVNGVFADLTYGAYGKSLNAYADLNAENNRLYVMLQGASVSNVTSDTIIGTLNLKFKERTSGDSYSTADLDSSSIILATKDEIPASQYVAYITEKTDYSHLYDWTKSDSDVSTWENDLAKPVISYTNSNVKNLHGVKVDAASKYVNVPKLLPSAESDVEVAVQATAYADTVCTDVFEGSVNYVYTLSMTDKDGDTVSSEELANYVSVDNADSDAEATVTVKAGAPEGTLTVTATGTSQNDKVTFTAFGECVIKLCHGTANSESGSDTDPDNKDENGDPKPIAPSDTEDSAPKFSGVVVYEQVDESIKTLVTSSAGDAVPYEKGVAIPDADSTNITFVGEMVDDYGVPMNDGSTVAWWTLNPDDATGVSASEGVVTVQTGADAGDYVYTYSAGAYSASINLAINGDAITWPQLESNALKYGQTLEVLKFKTTGSVADKDGTAIDNATFTWNVGQTLTCASTEAVMTCTYSAGTKTATHKYAIAVDKADLTLKTAVDESIEGTGESATLEVGQGETIELGAWVENTLNANDKPEATYNYTVTAIGEDSTSITVGATDGKLNTDSAALNDTAMLTITATTTDQDNYNNVQARQIKVLVSKPTLKAKISFDTTTPVYKTPLKATITADENQANSLTAGVTYQWGYITTEDGEKKFNALSESSNLVGGTSEDVAYTPTLEDIGRMLALQVNSDAASATYKWQGSVLGEVENAVAKASWDTFCVAEPTVTTKSVTVAAEKDALYAIALKSSETEPSVVDADSATDGHTWVSAVAGEDGTMQDVVFTQDDAGDPLKANTEYTVFMKKQAAGYEDSTIVTCDTKTAQIKLTGEDVDADVSDVNVTATIEGTLKFGETLTAKPSVSGTYNGEAITIADGEWTYQWKRGADEATATDIESATAANYTTVEADLDQKLFVTIKTAESCAYDATVTAATSDVIDKADGPAFTNTLTVEKKATNASTADGVLAGLTTGTQYEIAEKPTETETEPTWASKTADENGKFTDLKAGTYLIRIPATTTHKASEEQTVTVETNGFDITGKVTSYNAALGISYELYKLGENGQYEESASLTGNLEITPDGGASTAGKHTEDFKIANIPAGTYKLVLFKRTHLKFTISNIQISNADVALNENQAVGTIYLVPGDLDENGKVNALDTNRIFDASAFGKATSDVSEGVAWSDLDGNGVINALDTNLVYDANHFGKTKDDSAMNVALLGTNR